MVHDSELRPVKRWDWIWRGVFETDHDGSRWVVDVDLFDLRERVRLYRDGRLVESARAPALIAIDEDARIEADLSLYGMKYVRLVHADGAHPIPLRPCPGTAEAWRARFEHQHPAASRVVAAASWTVLAVALLTQLPELVDLVAGPRGYSVPTLELPGWANASITAAGVLAGLERALRLKHNPWLDE